jgi:predicted secreted protein
MRKSLAVLLPPLVALGVAAPSASALTVTATKADSGRSITIGTGDRLVVELAENRSQPALWAVTRDPTSRILRTVSDAYVPPAVAPGATPTPGAPGVRRFVWRGAKRGTTRFKLELLPTVGDDPAPFGTFRLTVKVAK